MAIVPLRISADLTDFPSTREIDPVVDVLAMAGIDIENLGTHIIDRDGNNLRFQDPQVGGPVTLQELLEDDFSNGGDIAGATRSLGNIDNFPLQFIVNNDPRIFIATDGDIGFGTTTPLARFFVQGSNPGQEVFAVRGTAGQTDSLFEARNDANTVLVAIQPDGDLNLQNGADYLLNGSPLNIYDLNGIQSVQLQNTNTSTNLNANSGNFTILMPFGGTQSGNNTNGDFTVNLGASSVTCNFTGRIKIDVNAHVFSNSSRVNVQIRTRLNGTPIGPIGNSYIRDASNHQEATSMISGYELDVTPGDVITIGSRQEANNGTATFDESGSSTFAVMRIA